MANTFLAQAGKKTTDVRAFLRDSAGNNSLKYRPEAGQKHFIHIPCQVVPVTSEDGSVVNQPQIIAISGAVHEWQSPDGKYKATICLKDVVRKDDAGNILNDGSCAFCDRIGDAWDIYRYRFDLESATCGKYGDDLEKHLEKKKADLASERKAKEARNYIYILVVKFRTDSNGKPTIGQDGLPEYDLKVMKLSDSRVEKLNQQLENSGATLPGAEVIFEYPKTDDARLVVSQSTTAPVFPTAMFTKIYPGLIQKIDSDVAKFSWDGIEKSFQEWQGMSTAEAEKTAVQLFEKWDEYKKQLQLNPNAKYMEYVGTGAQGQNPALGAGTQSGPMIPGAAPQIPGMGVPTQAPQIPGMAPQVPGMAPQVNNAGAPAGVPGQAPQVPGMAPQVPGMVQGAAPQVPGMAPGMAPGVVPGVVPGMVPGAAPQVGNGVPDANAVFGAPSAPGVNV